MLGDDIRIFNTTLHIYSQCYRIFRLQKNRTAYERWCRGVVTGVALLGQIEEVGMSLLGESNIVTYMKD